MIKENRTAQAHESLEENPTAQVHESLEATYKKLVLVLKV